MVKEKNAKIIKNFIEVFIERIWPYAITVILGALFYKAKINEIKNFKDILTCNVTFASIIIGFLATMLSILVASSDKPVVVKLKNKNKFKLLNLFITIPIIVGFISVISSFFLIPNSESKTLSTSKLFYIFICLTILFIATAIRAITVMVFLINNIDNPNDIEERDLDIDE